VARSLIELLEQMPRPKGPSDEALAVARTVDHLMDMGLSQGKARQHAVDVFKLSIDKVDIHHRRYGLPKKRRAKE
jgi:hypothetical protein